MAIQASTVTTRAAERRLQPAGFAIRDALDSYRWHLESPTSGNLSPVTVRTYLSHLEKLAAFLESRGMPSDVGLIRREHVAEYFDHLSKNVPNRKGGLGVRPATLSVAFRSIRPFWKWLIEEGDIAESPMAKMSQPRVPEDHKRVITAEEVMALLETCDVRTFEGCRDAAIIALLFDRGLRRGELAGLTAQDIDMRRRSIIIRAEVSKSGRAREISFGNEAGRRLDRYIKRRNAHPKRYEDAFWLQSRRGHGWLKRSEQVDLSAPEGGITGNGILQMLRRRAKAAGVEKVYTHAFRHGFVHAAYEAEMPEDAIMRTTGHTDVKMVRRVYGARHAQERANRAAVEFDPLDRHLRGRRPA